MNGKVSMFERLSLLLYSIMMHLMVPFVRLRLLKKGQQEAGYLNHVQERFGFYDGEASQGLIWIHAVSLGETRVAMILINRIRQSLAHARFLLTHGTATGRQEGLTLLRDGDVQVWQAWDTPQAVNRFLEHFKPRVGLFIETEIWPNLLAGAHKRNIPTVLLNARMSQSSYQKALKLRFLSRPAFRSFDFATAQNQDDALLLKNLGCRVKQVLGNIKFDAQLNMAQIEWGKVWQSKRLSPMIVLASSREGEEAMFLEAIEALSDQDRTRVLWCIVPRHPQRFEGVATLIGSRGHALLKRSSFQDFSEITEQNARDRSRVSVFLGDSLGEMNFYYASAHVALLGGSFLPFGGQNLIESIACECPMLMGPHTFNFKEVALQASQMGAARQVVDVSAAVIHALSLVDQRVDLMQMKRLGQEFIHAHQGATELTYQAIEHLLVNAPSVVQPISK